VNIEDKRSLPPAQSPPLFMISCGEIKLESSHFFLAGSDIVSWLPTTCATVPPLFIVREDAVGKREEEGHLVLKHLLVLAPVPRGPPVRELQVRLGGLVVVLRGLSGHHTVSEAKGRGKIAIPNKQGRLLVFLT